MGPAAGISFVVLRINRATLRLPSFIPSPLQAPLSTTSCAPARSTFPSTFYPLCAPRHEYRQAIRDSSLYPRPPRGCCHLRVEVQRKDVSCEPCVLSYDEFYTKKSCLTGGRGGVVVSRIIFLLSFFLSLGVGENFNTARDISQHRVVSGTWTVGSVVTGAGCIRC